MHGFCLKCHVSNELKEVCSRRNECKKSLYKRHGQNASTETVVLSAAFVTSVALALFVALCRPMLHALHWIKWLCSVVFASGLIAVNFAICSIEVLLTLLYTCAL